MGDANLPFSTTEVWTLVDLPDGVNPIGCKWVFKLKTDKHGNVYVYKVRLVDETFSLVEMLKSIRILLAIAAFYNNENWQIDVKTAFLNGFLNEDVYMTQPEGFEDPKNLKRVCKLQSSH